MAQKKITDLILRDSVTDELNIPSDDGIQSYRVTASQFKDYILAAGNVLRAAITPAERTPIGAVIPFAGTSAPTGYLMCSGQAVSRTTYAALFAVIGSSHGEGDGSTTFNLPDYRGRFLRGVDDGEGRDPNSGGRTAMNTGGNTGDAVGSIQGHAFQRHNHTQSTHSHDFRGRAGTGDNAFSASTYLANNAGGGASMARTSGTTFDNDVSVRPASAGTISNADASGTHAQASSSETRPVNAAVNFLIKY